MFRIGPEGGAEVHPELAGDDLGQGGLAEAGRAKQQDVVQRLGARARAASMNTLRLALIEDWPTNSGQGLGPQSPVGRFKGGGLARNQSGHRPSSRSDSLIKVERSTPGPSAARI